MPGFDVGSIESTLTLNRDDFIAGLEEAQAEGDEFEAEGITVPLYLDTSDFEAKLAAAEAAGQAAGAGGAADEAGAGEGAVDTTAIDALDDALVQAAQDSDVLGASLSSLGGEDAIVAATGLAGLNTGADALDATLGGAALTAADFTAGVSDATRAVSGLTPEVDDALSSIDAMEMAVAGLGVEYADVSDALERAGESVSGLSEIAADSDWTITGLAGAIAQLVANGDSVPAFLDEVKNGMLPATEAAAGLEAGLVDVGGAADGLEVSAAAADAALDKIIGTIINDAVPATKTATGFINDLQLALSGFGGGEYAGGVMALGAAFDSLGGDVSTVLQWVLALAPELAAVAAAAVGFGGAMVGGLLTAAGAFGAFALAAAGDMQNLESEFSFVEQTVESWASALAPVIDSGLQPFLEAVAPLLQSLSPVVTAVSGAFRELGTAFQQVVSGGAWQSFVSFLSQIGPQVIESIVTAIEKFAGAVADMAEGAAPVIQMLDRGFVSLGQDLENFANSNGFQEFVNWLLQNGPTIGQEIATIAGVVEHLFTDFAEVGGYLMPVIEDISKFVELLLEIPGVGPIVAIGTAIAGIGMIAAPALLTVGASLGALSGGGLAAGVGMAAGLGVGGVAMLGLVGVSAAATVEIGDHWSGVQTAASDVGNWFSDSMPHFFESGFDDITGTASDWEGHVGDVMVDAMDPAERLGSWMASTFPGFFEAGYNDVVSWTSTAFGDVVSFLEGLPNRLLQIGEDIINGLWDGLKAAWNDVFGWLEDAANDIIKILALPGSLWVATYPDEAVAA